MLDSSLTLAYCLQADARDIEMLQQASLNPEPSVGLVLENGLIGTAEWWNAIQNGTLRTGWSHGAITLVTTGQDGDGDYPLVRYQTKTGETEEMTLRGRPELYKVGRELIRLFVEQAFKRQVDGLARMSRIDLMTWVRVDGSE